MTDKHIDYRQYHYNDIVKNKKYGDLIGLTAIELNVTELCNRKCFFCPRHDSDIYPNRNDNMTDAVIKQLAQQLKECSYKGIIYFSGFGEPLLNSSTLNYINFLKTELPECYIEMTTNGDFLTGDKIEIIKDSVDMIIIDCYDSEEQMHTREKLLKTYNFSKYKFRKLWYTTDTDRDTKVKEWNFNNRSGAVKNIAFKLNSNRCYLPFYRITVDWNGDIILCCNDWFRQQKGLGNVLTTHIRDLWQSETLNNVRKNLKHGIRSDAACKNCSANGTLIGEESVDIISRYQTH